jgi:hypothetical protein
MNAKKYIIITALFSFFSSCHSNHSKNEKEEHIHTGSTSSSGYDMQFVIDPAVPTGGLETKFTLRPVKAGTDSRVNLEIQHEKKIHFIIVTEDLSSFRHLHPVEQTDGSYTLNYLFPHGGNYILYADYKPAGAEKQVAMKTTKITGQEEKPAVYDSQMLVCKTNGYTVTLKTANTAINSGKEQVLVAEIADTNGTLTPDQLENYLGEKAHMVIIGISGKKFLHVHPMVMGNELMLHTTFSEPGMYRAWLEFKKDGKVNLADFVIKAN